MAFLIYLHVFIFICCVYFGLFSFVVIFWNNLILLCYFNLAFIWGCCVARYFADSFCAYLPLRLGLPPMTRPLRAPTGWRESQKWGNKKSSSRPRTGVGGAAGLKARQNEQGPRPTAGPGDVEPRTQLWWMVYSWKVCSHPGPVSRAQDRALGIAGGRWGKLRRRREDHNPLLAKTFLFLRPEEFYWSWCSLFNLFILQTALPLVLRCRDRPLHFFLLILWIYCTF